MSEILEIATLHGPARAQLRLTKKPRGALVLGHGAGGGVNAPDLVAATRARAGGRASPSRSSSSPTALRGGARRRRRRSSTRRGRRSSSSCATASWPGCRSSPAGARPVHASRVAPRLRPVRPACSAWRFPSILRARPEKSRLDELDAVEVPVLVVQGERDPFGMPPDAPGRTVVRVAGDHGLKAGLAALEQAVGAWLEGSWLSSPGGDRRRERAARGDRSAG